MIESDRINNKNVNLSSNIKKMSSEVGFFNFKAKFIFIQYKKTFIKVLILYYFDLKHHIQIKIDTLDSTINRVLS